MGCFNAWLHWKATQAFHDHWICVIKCNFRIILCFQVLQWNQSVLLQRHFPGFRGFTNSLCSVCRETGLLHCCQQSQGRLSENPGNHGISWAGGTHGDHWSSPWLCTDIPAVPPCASLGALSRRSWVSGSFGNVTIPWGAVPVPHRSWGRRTFS